MATLDPRKSIGNGSITSRKAVPSTIKEFSIISNVTGKSVSILDGIVDFKYYESIMQNTVRVTVTYADTGVIKGDATNGKSVIEGLPLVGSEKVTVKFEDNNKIIIGDKPKLTLFVNKVTPLIGDSRKSMVALELVSKEFIMNEKGCTRVVRRQNGKISDTVKNIFEKNLKTDKDYKDIEITENNFNFIPNNKKPMYLLDWLSKKSVPEGKRGKSAGFFFWETYKGFHYRSIDWLLDKEKNKPKISIIFNDTGDDNGKDVPAGYQVKAIRYDKGNLIDVQNKFKMGFQSTRIILFNPFDGYYCVTPTEATTTERPSDTADPTTGKSINEIETAGKKLPKMNEELNCGGVSGKDFTRTTYYIKDTGTLNSGDTTEEQLKKSKEENFDFRLIENQAIQRYNQLYSSSTTITIPATFLLHAGDTVFIDDASLQVNTKNDEVDKEHGGLYLISDLIHYLDNTGTWTKINVVRDSFGRKGNAAAVGGN